MASILKNLRLAADPSRLRILLLVEREELSVAELQEILAMGQSRISTHLAQLKQAGMVEDRRDGKSVFYRLNAARNGNSKPFGHMLKLLRDAAAELPEALDDSEALRLVVGRRQETGDDGRLRVCIMDNRLTRRRARTGNSAAWPYIQCRQPPLVGR